MTRNRVAGVPGHVDLVGGLAQGFHDLIWCVERDTPTIVGYRKVAPDVEEAYCDVCGHALDFSDLDNEDHVMIGHVIKPRWTPEGWRPKTQGRT